MEHGLDGMKNSVKVVSADRFPFVPPLLAGLIRMYHRTCRFTVLGREHVEAAQRCGWPVLYATWHFAFPSVIYYFRDRDGALMVSRSRDGEWVARVLSHLGYRTSRGSPGKGGAVALREMLAHIRAGREAGLIADGSQGPARTAQKGILILARYAQAPLLPFSVAANPCWRFRSWDRTMLARPFARIVFAFGAPVMVERGASPERIEELRLHLEVTLNRLTEDAEKALR